LGRKIRNVWQGQSIIERRKDLAMRNQRNFSFANFCNCVIMLFLSEFQGISRLGLQKVTYRKYFNTNTPNNDEYLGVKNVVTTQGGQLDRA